MGSKRKGIGRKICLTPKRAALTLLMGAIAIAGALGISAHAATGQATDENLVGKTVYLNSDTKKFKNVKYGAGGGYPGTATGGFEVLGRAAYCSDPDIDSPKSQDYIVSELVPDKPQYHTADQIKRIIYYGYYGPGFDASMWPSTNMKGQPSTEDDYIVWTHIVLSDTMWSDGGKAFARCDHSYPDWACPKILGYRWGDVTASGYNRPGTVINNILNAPAVPDGFNVYMLKTGNNSKFNPGKPSQTIVFSTWNPEVNVTFKKNSSDATVTSSVAGATYEIYEGSSTTPAKTITIGADKTATVKLKRNKTYRLHETKAPKGYTINKSDTTFTTGTTDMTIDSSKCKNLSDQPNEVKLHKQTVDGTSSISKAQFGFWKKSDEVYLPNATNGYNLRVRADANTSSGSSSTYLYQIIDSAYVSASVPSGYKLQLKDGDGNVTEINSSQKAMDAGKYDVVLLDKNGKQVEDSDTSGGKTIELKVGDQTSLSVKLGSVTGKASVSVDTKEISDRKITATRDGSDYTFIGLKKDAKYSFKLNGTEIAVIDTKNDYMDAMSDHRIFGIVVNGTLRYTSMLLASGKSFINPSTESTSEKLFYTGSDGSLSVKGLMPGSYGIGEVFPPADKQNDSYYTINRKRLYFTVDGTTGAISGDLSGAVSASTTLTDQKIVTKLSKKSVTGDDEIPGAKLEIRDEGGKTIDTWTSTDKPHEISLEPGKYTLIETMTPNDYDQTTRIEFRVEDTGNVQHVSMEDKPLEINAKIDKRQEIADPSVNGAETDGNGKAQLTKSSTGLYAYSLDYTNESTTWTDEFTVTDTLDGVNDGYAKMLSITTAQGVQDFDGKMNVWYRTNKTPDTYADDKGKANATLEDGHVNPWIIGDTRGDDSKKSDPDGDGRALDYTGWRLWRKDVSTTAATTLDVSELDLAADEYITAFRFEYGRVEAGFTTRTSAWDRDNLKDGHDDLDSVKYVHEETFNAGNDIAVRSSVEQFRNIAKDFMKDTLAESGKKVSEEQLNKQLKAIDENFDGYAERLTEAINASDADAVRKIVDEVAESSKENLSTVCSGVTNSKTLDKALTIFGKLFDRLDSQMPSDIKASVKKVKESGAKAVDSGDPEAISDTVKDMQKLIDKAVDALSVSTTGQEIHYAPAIVRMQITKAYTPSTELKNSAKVDAYRNGGGEKLEGHDSDQVAQATKASNLASDLMQTGIDNVAYVAAIAIAGAVAVLVKKRMSARK